MHSENNVTKYWPGFSCHKEPITRLPVARVLFTLTIADGKEAFWTYNSCLEVALVLGFTLETELEPKVEMLWTDQGAGRKPKHPRRLTVLELLTLLSCFCYCLKTCDTQFQTSFHSWVFGSQSTYEKLVKECVVLCLERQNHVRPHQVWLNSCINFVNIVSCSSWRVRPRYTNWTTVVR